MRRTRSRRRARVATGIRRTVPDTCVGAFRGARRPFRVPSSVGAFKSLVGALERLVLVADARIGRPTVGAPFDRTPNRAVRTSIGGGRSDPGDAKDEPKPAEPPSSPRRTRRRRA